MLYTDDYIRGIFNNCKCKNFIQNENGIIDDPELSEYIDNVIEDVKKSMPENVANTIANNKTQYEIEHAANDIQVMFLNTISDISIAIFNYLMKKYYEESDVYKRVLCNILNHSMQYFEAIFAMYIDNTKVAILPQLRILYENYITFRFIGRHPDLAQPYFDHAILNKYKIVKEYNLQFSNADRVDEERLLQIYSKEFIKSYGWLPQSYRKPNMGAVESMEKDRPIEGSNEIYKISSDYIHSSPFVIFHDKIVDGLVSKYLYSVVVFLTNQIIELTDYYKCEPGDRILTMNLLYGLREDLYGEMPFSLKE